MNQVADTPPTGPRKVEWALLLTIVLGGAILRFVNIGLESFWYDEIHSLMKALNHPNQNTGLQILLPATDFFNQDTSRGNHSTFRRSSKCRGKLSRPRCTTQR